MDLLFAIELTGIFVVLVGYACSTLIDQLGRLRPGTGGVPELFSEGRRAGIERTQNSRRDQWIERRTPRSLASKA